MRELGERLMEIPGVVAVTLGGSRASGVIDSDGDWDFGLYYRDAIRADDVRALGFDGTVAGGVGFVDLRSALLDRQSALYGATPLRRTGIAAQLGYDHCRLERYPPAHLRAAMLAVVERDRNLLDAEAGA